MAGEMKMIQAMKTGEEWFRILVTNFAKMHFARWYGWGSGI
jgi:hypothetical protein